LDNCCLENNPAVCHNGAMAKKKSKKSTGRTKTVAAREWTPGQPFESLEKRPANSAKKVKV
jgi:hypothetical protein